MGWIGALGLAIGIVFWNWFFDWMHDDHERKRAERESGVRDVTPKDD